MNQSSIITMDQVSHQHRHESQGSLEIQELHLDKIGNLHFTLVDEDGNQFDLDIEPITSPTTTPAAKVTEKLAEAQHIPDGVPRIPKTGDIIKLFGKYNKVKRQTMVKRKLQVYVIKPTNPANNNEENSITD